ncbi:MAG: hypothetical protein ACYCXW_15885 [Solirubrobacteraceae bacterium]
MAHRRMLALGLVVAVVAAVMSVYRLDGFGLAARGGVHHSTATTEILVDSQPSALGDLNAPSSTLTSLAQTLANFAPNRDVLNLIGRYAGLQGTQIYAQGPAQPNLPRTVLEPSASQRNVELTGETAPYRLEFDQNPLIPAIGVYAQAPTTAEAVKLANASYLGLRDYLKQLQVSGAVSPAHQVVLRQLGSATGTVDSPSAAKALALLALVGTFALWCVLLLVAERVAELWRATGDRVQVRRGRQPILDCAPGSPGQTANGFHEAASSSSFADAIAVARRDDRQ